MNDRVPERPRAVAKDAAARLDLDWSRVFSEAAGPIAALDLDGRYVQANRAFCELVGCPVAQLVEAGGWCASQSAGGALAEAALSAMSASGQKSGTAEHLIRRADGSTAWIGLDIGVVPDDHGATRYFLLRAEDVTERRAAEALWQAMFDRSPIGMGLLDLTGRWEKVNPALCQLLGRSSGELVGIQFAELTFPGDEGPDAAALEVLRRGAQDGHVVTLEKRYRHHDGHPIWLLIRATVLPGSEGHPARILSYYEDISERRLADARLSRLALHDPLTGLANRALLADRLEAAQARLDREKGALAVLYCDLDDFKQVNDQHGHAVGDQLLIAAARALQASTRSTDTVARVGGDEFVVVAPLANEHDAEILRATLSRRLDVDVVAGSRRLRLRATVGVATLTDPTGDIAQLVEEADRDMYARKAGWSRADRVG